MTATLRLGSAGEDVAIWQAFIAKAPKPTTWSTASRQARAWRSEWSWPIDADGSFGAKTQAATEAWQASHGLSADGVVGTNTWQASGIMPSPGHELLRGVDLSAIQGAAGLTDGVWSQLADAGIRFAILRLQVGNDKGSDIATVKANVARAHAHGIAAGAYFFPYPLPHLDPKAQIDHFVSLMFDAFGQDQIGCLPPAFDMEWPPPEERDATGKLVDVWAKRGCSASQIRDWCLTALERGEELTGRDWLVYSYRYWLTRIEAQKAPELGNRPLWLADYTYRGIWPSGKQIANLKPPAPWSSISIVQHDGDGGLKLPNGVDADFNVLIGGVDRLRDLVTIGGGNSTKPAYSAMEAPLGAVPDAAIARYRRDREDTGQLASG